MTYKYLRCPPFLDPKSLKPPTFLLANSTAKSPPKRLHSIYIYNTYILYCRCHFRCSTSVALHCIAALYQTWQRHISIKTPLILARETISQPGIFSGVSNILQLSFGGILQFETNVLQHLKEGCNEPTWVIVEKWE